MFRDIVKGVGYGIYYSKEHILKSYFLVPVGIILEFTILYGLNQFIVQILKIKFPASVMGMLINLIVLCILTFMSKYHKIFETMLNRYLSIVQPSMSFSLKWINVFFIPSFIILPLSKPITIIEVLKIAGVFVIGWWTLMVINIYTIQLLKILFDLARKEAVKEVDDVNKADRDITDITTINLRQVRTEPVTDSADVELMDLDNPFLTRPEKTHIKHSSIPANVTIESHGVDHPSMASIKLAPSQIARRESTSSSGSGSVTEETENSDLEAYRHLNPTSKKVTIFITSYIDWVLYGLLFISSIPLFYTPYHIFLPFHLSITILLYYVALLIPLKWPFTKKFAHPILVSTFLILFICFISSLIYHQTAKGFLDDLKYYKTGKNYLNLFSSAYLFNNGETNPDPENSITKYPIWPGCGDFLSSLMDISIVSLSLPMYTHRRDFIKNAWIMIPILMSIGLTFFLYPLICYNIGIDPQRSIGFIGRSVTLALGTPLIDSLEGSISLMAVCTILSGICGVLIGDAFFKLLRVKSGDYVTRGVSLGINCGAIATAHLLNVDPRAASMSSLSFTIFGTIMIIFASIGDIRTVVHTLVGQ